MDYRKEQGELSGVMYDQIAKTDKGKLRITLVPTKIIEDIAMVRMYGVSKYPNGGKDNWKKVEIERYRDALCRHLIAYINNPKGNDEESGLPHLWHLACNVAFLCELEEMENTGMPEKSAETCEDEVLIACLEDFTKEDLKRLKTQICAILGER